jgi:hypothetical protein
VYTYANSDCRCSYCQFKVNNGVLGIQHPQNFGTMIYMTPLGNGVARPKANWGEGWGSKNHRYLQGAD